MLCNFCLVFVMLLCASVHDALWSPDLLALVMISNCEVVTFPLVSWVRCGACLYPLLIFALSLTFITEHVISILESFFFFRRHSHTVINFKTSMKESSLYTCLKAG